MCTSITRKTKDGIILQGRTNEFEAYYNSETVFVPANTSIQSNFVSQRMNTLKNKYSMLYVSAPGIISNPDVAGDAMNEHGLSVSVLYFHYHEYKELDEDTEVNEGNINFMFSARDIAGNYKTVQEVREAKAELDERYYWPKGFSQAGLGFHLMIVDSTGDGIVIEPENKEMVIKENPVGVMTNSSPLEYHYENLRQYSHMSPYILDPIMKWGKLENHKLNTVGNSLLGTPGDFQANSRFVRVAILNSTAVEAEGVEEGVTQIFRILNTSDIVQGYVRENMDNAHFSAMKKMFPSLIEIDDDKEGVTITSHTDNTIVKDLTNKVWYYKTAPNQTIRFVDIKKLVGTDKVVRLAFEGDNTPKFFEVELV